MERLQKIIARSGYCSRRKAEELIKDGKVRVNNKVIKELGFKASYGDEIVVEGKMIEMEDFVYYLIYKPSGYLSNVSDDKERKVVVDLVEEETRRIYPVGKLDYDTSGLLLLSNDGEFSNILTHPTSKVMQVFQARISGILSPDSIKKLERGIVIDGFKNVPAKVKIREKDKRNDSCLVEIRMYEGKTPQIKKMLNQLGHNVKKIKRIALGELRLGEMQPCDYRKLTIHEVKRMTHLARMGQK